MALQFDVNPLINEFVSSIPERMMDAPWYYNNTLLSGLQASSLQLLPPISHFFSGTKSTVPHFSEYTRYYVSK